MKIFEIYFLREEQRVMRFLKIDPTEFTEKWGLCMSSNFKAQAWSLNLEVLQKNFEVHAIRFLSFYFK